MYRQGGMTLVELLIVVGILGILMAAAIPVYDSYLIRTRVAGGLSVATDAKFAVSETYHSEGSVPNQAAIGYNSPPASPEVSSIAIAGNGSGEITITYTVLAGGGTIILQPILIPGQAIDWICTGGTLAVQYRPSECR